MSFLSSSNLALAVKVGYDTKSVNQSKADGCSSVNENFDSYLHVEVLFPYL